MVEVSSKLSSLLFTVAGAFCCGIAAVAATLFAPHSSRAVVPILFIVFIAALAAYFGVAAGVIGTLLATVVFATFMYPPIGSVTVQVPAGRAALAWMVLGGISLSYLFGLEPHVRK